MDPTRTSLKDKFYLHQCSHFYHGTSPTRTSTLHNCWLCATTSLLTERNESKTKVKQVQKETATHNNAHNLLRCPERKCIIAPSAAKSPTTC